MSAPELEGTTIDVFMTSEEERILLKMVRALPQSDARSALKIVLTLAASSILASEAATEPCLKIIEGMVRKGRP